jgi:ABC-type transporter Mla subunit MlaD
LLAGLIDDDQLGDTVASAALALSKFGKQAHSALPSLRAALNRTYTYAEPSDRLTATIHAQVQGAITAIDAP